MEENLKKEIYDSIKLDVQNMTPYIKSPLNGKPVCIFCGKEINKVFNKEKEMWENKCPCLDDPLKSSDTYSYYIGAKELLANQQKEVNELENRLKEIGLYTYKDLHKQYAIQRDAINKQLDEEIQQLHFQEEQPKVDMKKEAAEYLAKHQEHNNLIGGLPAEDF